MQYGWALDLIVREVVISGLDLVPIYLLKVDVSNGFFLVALQPYDTPKLGLVSSLTI